MPIPVIVAAATVLALTFAAIRIVREYERVVVFRFGQLRGAPRTRPRARRLPPRDPAHRPDDAACLTR